MLQWRVDHHVTVAGTFTVNDDSLTPYVLDVEKVSNITQKK